MLVKVYAAACCGIEALTVTIEVDVGPGLNFFLVGLPDSAVRESQQRITTALEGMGLHLPGRRVVVNMAPADLRKEGAAYDLPIALGIMAASQQMQAPWLQKVICMGEVALDGSLRPFKGALSVALHARDAGFEAVLFPLPNACEAACVEGIAVYGLTTLSQVVALLQGSGDPAPLQAKPWDHKAAVRLEGPDFAQVMGQHQAKRALEVAAAGGHNVLLCGSPGAGKTFMARCLPGILPPLSREEALETTRIYSVAGLHPHAGEGLLTQRPFRAPHHSASLVSICGGGARALPGEISLAHNGVLYLDELPEFPRSVLEVLRQPLEEHCIRISRARYKVDYPARFMLAASMNPCPCGYDGHPEKACTCTPYQVQRYRSRISGPLLDRMDMYVKVAPVPARELFCTRQAESSAVIRERVAEARRRQQSRFAEHPGLYTNAQIPPALIQCYCRVESDALSFMQKATERLGLSARASHRILRLARTVADLDGSAAVRVKDVAEAVRYR